MREVSPEEAQRMREEIMQEIQRLRRGEGGNMRTETGSDLSTPPAPGAGRGAPEPPGPNPYRQGSAAAQPPAPEPKPPAVKATPPDVSPPGREPQTSEDVEDVLERQKRRMMLGR